MIDILICGLIGLGLGILTGIIPGIHPNLIAGFLLASAGLMAPAPFMVLIVVTLLSSNFFEIIKTTYLSVPDEGSILATYPANKLLHDGRGLEAVKLMAMGGLGSLLVGISLVMVMIKLVPIIYEVVKPAIGLILLIISLHLILREGKKLNWALLVYLLAGLLGLTVLRNELINESLLPMLTGFFGVSLLVTNINKKAHIPSQMKQVVVDIERKQLGRGIIKGFLSGSILSFIPGIGPAQASLITSELSRKKDEKEFLISIQGTNTADVLFSLIALLTINKSRSGLLEVIKQTTGVSLNDFSALIIVMLLTGVIAYYLVIRLANPLGQAFSRINYSKLSKGMISFIAILVILFCGPVGLLVLLISSLVGIIANSKDVNRSHLMACLVLPTMVYFLQ